MFHLAFPFAWLSLCCAPLPGVVIWAELVNTVHKKNRWCSVYLYKSCCPVPLRWIWILVPVLIICVNLYLEAVFLLWIEDDGISLAFAFGIKWGLCQISTTVLTRGSYINGICQFSPVYFITQLNYCCVYILFF